MSTDQGTSKDVRRQIVVTKSTVDAINRIRGVHKTTQYALIDAAVKLIDQMSTDQQSRLIRGEMKLAEIVHN